MPELFDSRDLSYRAPFGAVAVGTEVLFRICLPRNWGCHAATLLIEQDNRPEQYNGMFWAGMCGDDHEWWDVRFTPTEAAAYFYGFQLELALGTGWLVCRPDGRAEYSYVTRSPRWQLTAYEAEFATPDWLAGGILYQIFPDRFAASGQPKENVPADRVLHGRWDEEIVWQPDEQGRVRNNDYFGGDLAGITDKLDYLAGLGVTCLYLNPIFEAHSNHRYDTADYTRVDPLLGTEEDLRRLTREAQRRGIRVILDGVFSHTGADSVYFNRERRYPDEGAYNSLSSPYRSWYQFSHWPREYHSWWGFDTLPEVNELDPAFLRYIAGDAGVLEQWQRDGAAGWRLDVADELPDGFLDALRRRVKATDPQALVLDSVMNYAFRQAILRFLLEGGRAHFFDPVLSIIEHYPPQVLRLLMNHIGTHDTERALTLLGGEPSRGRGRSWQAAQTLSPAQQQTAVARLKLATLLQFSLPGVPCIYYGDEAGMEGYKDPFNRRTYPWGREDAELLDWYRTLGACRRQQTALAEGSFTPLPSGEELVAYTRGEGAGAVLCAVNRAEMEHTLLLPPAWADSRVLCGVGTCRERVLHLPPLSGVWLGKTMQ